MTTTKTRVPFDSVKTTQTLNAPEREGRYRRVYASHEVAHRWAAYQQPEANGGNVFFHSGTIFSYGSHFPMARHVRLRDGRHVIFFTTRKYSVSTAKHLSWVRYAIPDNIPVFRVANVTADTRREHRDNFAAMKSEAVALVEQSTKARQRKASLLAEAAGVVRRANEYAEAVGLRERLAEPSADDVAQWMAEERAERRKAEERESAKRKAAVKKALAEWEGKVKAWQAGEDVYLGTCPGPHPWGNFDFLRVKGNVLQTSQRVSVPLRLALPVLQMIRDGKEPPEGFKIDDFTLREINPEEKIVRVGCHTVSFDEIERLAKTLGL